jgi:hypothetical protein
MEIKQYIALSLILQQLKQKGRSWVLEQLGDKKVAPGITVADYLQMQDFYSRVGTSSPPPVLTALERKR